MPRAPRIEFAGAIYHVMNRGNQLRPIFRDAADRKLFLTTLAETCRSAGWSVHSFMLMGNHYHLLLETHRATLVKGMQYLNSTYTQRFNVRHKTRGHLFQGRYKALLVDGEAKNYFLAVSDYIHLNPARVGAVNDREGLWRDPWSSAGWLGGMRRERPDWLRWERVYGELDLAKWRSTNRRQYRKYLERRLVETLAEGRFQQRQRLEGIRRGWCLGSMGFVDEMKGRLRKRLEEERDTESWAGEAVETLEEDLARRDLSEGARRLGYREAGAVKGLDRYLLARWIRSRTKVSLKWIAGELRCKTVPGLRSSISRVGRLLEADANTAKRWKTLVSQHNSD